MDISDQDVNQGAVLVKLVRAAEDFNIQNLRINTATSKNSFYLSNVSTKAEDSVAIYVKHTKKNRSPWMFTFNQEHQEEVEVLQNLFKCVFVLFVCGRDGIAGLSYEELKVVLDEEYEEVEGVSVKRKIGGNYWVSGRDGSLKKSITRSHFLEIIFNSL